MLTYDAALPVTNELAFLEGGRANPKPNDELARFKDGGCSCCGSFILLLAQPTTCLFHCLFVDETLLLYGLKQCKGHSLFLVGPYLLNVRSHTIDVLLLLFARGLFHRNLVFFNSSKTMTSRLGRHTNNSAAFGLSVAGERRMST